MSHYHFLFRFSFHPGFQPMGNGAGMLVRMCSSSAVGRHSNILCTGYQGREEGLGSHISRVQSLRSCPALLGS